MRDKRKIIFCIICLIITIIYELFLYKEAVSVDEQFKKMMSSKLSNVSKELETRNFEKKSDYLSGRLEYERNTEEHDYGYICIDYDIMGNISDIDLKLEYSDNLYIDDVFYDSYYIFNLLGLNIENEYNFETEPANNFSIENEIFVNENRYNYTITKTEDKKIQFEIN